MIKVQKIKRRFLSVFLALCMVLSLMPLIPLKVEASTNGHTRDEAVEWIRGKIGTAVDYDGVWGVQCVDLIKLYYIYLGQTPRSGGDGYAYEYYRTYSVPAGWTRYTNSQTNPEPGDVVVFDAYAYGALSSGHVGIVLESDSQNYYYVDYNGMGNNDAGTRRDKPIKNFTCVIRPDWPVSNEWDGYTPEFFNINQNAGEDFYAYIVAECSNSYLESSLTLIDNQGATNVQLSAKPEYIGTSLDPRKIWHFLRSPGADYYTIINEYCGWPLDVAGGIAGENVNVATWHENHGGYPQRWIALNGGYNMAGGPLYRLATALGRPQNIYFMDVEWGRDAEGTNIQLWPRSSDGQKITITQISYSKPAQPAAPSNVVAVVTSSSDGSRTYSVSWNAVPTVSGGYDSREYEVNIYKGFSAGGEPVLTQITTATSCQLGDSLESGDYFVQVRAVNTKYYNYYSDFATASFTIKQNATITAWPTATEIFYGQTLSDSQLFGGEASIAGSFNWIPSSADKIRPEPNEIYDVIFIPEDTIHYNKIFERIPITVKKTTPKISSVPTTTEISCGEKLSTSLFIDGVAINPYDNENISGSWQWCDSEQTPSESGKYQAVFIPDNTVCYQNSEPVDVDVTVEEEKEPGGPEEHTHIYNSDWQSDEENHWKECECGNKSETATHDFVWESDEGSSSRYEVCSVCGYIGKTENNPGGDGDSDKDKIEVESISLDKDTLTIRIGEQESLKVTVSPENATYKTLIWESSDTSVVEINDSGIITAKSTGAATVTVETTNGKTASCQITVEESKDPEEHNHVYNSDWKSDQDNHWKECECGNKSETANHSFVWETDEGSSSRHEVCSVCGYIGKTENNPGGDGDSDKDKIEVESISLDKDTLTIRIGEQESLKVTVSPENATDKTLIWESSDTSVVEINDSGIITAKSTGAATVTVETTNGKTASCQITVEESKEPEEHNHVYNSDWKSDQDNHWKECECGNKSETANHSFVWETDEGSSSQHEVCSVCGYIGKTDGSGVSNPDTSENPDTPENPNTPDNTDNPKPSEPKPIMPNDYSENNLEQYMVGSTADYVEIPVMWEPTTSEEKRRYECFGKEKVSYIVSEENNYDIIIKNEMQGSLCFNAFDVVLDDYTIGRTYNIYPYNNMTYMMEEEIQFTLRIPTDIYKPDRKYRMICVTENGQPYILEDMDDNPETITVRTCRFFAYALIYR